jgi:hypothetical protein
MFYLCQKLFLSSKSFVEHKSLFKKLNNLTACSEVDVIYFCFIILGRPQPDLDVDEDLAERMSAMRRPGESDMDYFERRYQERVSPL